MSRCSGSLFISVVLLGGIGNTALAQPDFGRGGGSSSGGFFRRGFSEEDMQRRFRDYDKNGDGRLTIDEVSDRMKPYFATADKNQDGALDFGEYVQYVNERMASFGMGMGMGMGGTPGFGSPPGMMPPSALPAPGNVTSSSSGPTPSVPTPPVPPPGGFDYGYRPFPPPPFDGRGYYDTSRRDEPKDKDKKDKDKSKDNNYESPNSTAKPVAIRYGKLPKGLPDWFATLDSDKDGQIGLYEWRRGNRPTAEFLALDLNNDGLLTAEEYLQGERLASESKKQEELLAALGASSLTSTSAGNRPGTPKSGATEDSGPPRSTPGRNPFTSASSDSSTAAPTNSGVNGEGETGKRRFFGGFGRK